MNPIKIGTRDSALALWQAQDVADQLAKIGIPTVLVPVKSAGDLNTSTPLHQMGTTGLFTKVLDDALLNHTVDIAVHSLKDYPTQAPEGLAIAATLERAFPYDLLVPKTDADFLQSADLQTIATGSIRRKAQWLWKFPHHKVENLRGNVQTRLQKLADNPWQGAIFAAAGLDRLNLRPANAIVLDWMVPAPAQGIVGVGCRAADADIVALLQKINNPVSAIQSRAERQFLRTLEGGCSAPIGALLQKDAAGWQFTGVLTALDGSAEVRVHQTIAAENLDTAGADMAQWVLENGGAAIMKAIKHAGF